MNRKIVLIASLIAGLLAALLTSAYVSAKEEEVRARVARFNRENERIETFRFTRDMYEGAEIRASDIEPCTFFRRHGEDLVTPGSEQRLIGRRTTCRVPARTPIRWPYVEGGRLEEKGLADRIAYTWGGPGEKPLSHRAISITVSGATSVSGFIRTGDYVDVIGTFDFPDDEGRIRRGDPVTCTILQRVLVLATGDARPADRALGVTAAGARAGDPSLVTLSVTPREAEILAFAENVKGRLMLTLRNGKDAYVETDLPVVTFNEIRAEMSRLNDERVKASKRL